MPTPFLQVLISPSHRECWVDFVDRKKRSECPTCGVPSWIKNSVQNKKLENMATAITNLEKLSNDYVAKHRQKASEVGSCSRAEYTAKEADFAGQTPTGG